MQLSTPIAALMAIAVTFGGGYAFVSWKSTQDRENREAARAARIAERAEREADLRAQLEVQMEPVRKASRELVPDALEGAILGMTLDGLLEARQVRPKHDGTREAMSFFEERLESGAQVIYGVDTELDILTQMQIMSAIPPEDVGPHLEAMVARYGAPTGIWNCPASGAAGVPMRRITWRGSAVTLQDILLIHPSGVSQTLYIATTETIAASLRISHCQAVRTEEDLDALPVALPDQMREVIENSGQNVVY